MSFSVVFSSSAGANFSASLDNQTYTAFGAHFVSLATGTYEIGGTYTDSFNSFPVGFSVPINGGARSGSVQSLAGPALASSPCRIQYLAATQQPFRIRFTVSTDLNAACTGL